MGIDEDAVVETALGTLVGSRRNGVSTFRGVPYAQPASGPLRFAAPDPVGSWRERRDARRNGPIAPQLPSRLRKVMGDFEAPQGEGCLSLTIATPGPDFGKRPVLVWLHGGGYSSGAGSLDWYGGETLARDGDVVVVGVNYRLGALGYLHARGVAAGNFGLQDQSLALRWVAEHISEFGGDPDNVTCMGQSAGAHSIACMLAAPGQPLFRRAILQSTPVAMLPQEPETADRIGRSFVLALGVDPDGPQALARLQEVPLPAILQAQAAVARAEARSGDPSPPFLPYGDGRLVPERGDFLSAVRKGVGKVDLIIGTTREEMTAFYAFDEAIQSLGPEALSARNRAERGSGADSRLARLVARRPAATPADLLGDLVTEDLFLLPSLRLAEAGTSAGRRAYVYQFDWPAADPALKACHCLELPFLFGDLTAWGDSPMVAGIDPAHFDALSKMIRGAWIAFAREGTPASPSLPRWPPYEPGRRLTMRYARVSGPVGDLADLADEALAA